MGRTIVLSEYVLKRLREYFNNLPNIEFAAIIGSVATKGYSSHDIDLVVKVKAENKYEELLKVIDSAAKILNVGPESIDIIDIDRADLELKKRVLELGIVLIDRGYLKELMHEVMELYPEYHEYLSLSIREWLSSRDPTDVDPVIIKRRLDFVRSEIDFLNQYVLSKSLDEVKSSPILKRLLERSYQLVVEAVVDVCRHIVSAKGWGPAFRATDFIQRCCEQGVTGSEVCRYFINAIKLRNIIVHRYLEIDYDKLYEESRKLIHYAKEFERQITNYLRNIGKTLDIST